MTLRNFAERARQIVSQTLFAEGDAELDRLLVGDAVVAAGIDHLTRDAVVAREGEHYRIESGDDSWRELQAHARRLEGLCDCGALLSTLGERSHCRTCGREFRV